MNSLVTSMLSMICFFLVGGGLSFGLDEKCTKYSQKHNKFFSNHFGSFLFLIFLGLRRFGFLRIFLVNAQTAF